MSAPTPSMPAGTPLEVPVGAASSVWDRIKTWVSENKATVYPVAGVVVVVTGAGVVYYLKKERDSVRAPRGFSRAAVFPCRLRHGFTCGATTSLANAIHL